MRPWARSTAMRWPLSSSVTCAVAAPVLGASPLHRASTRWAKNRDGRQQVDAGRLTLFQRLGVGAGGATERDDFGVHLGHQLSSSFTDRKFADRGGHHRLHPAEQAHPARAVNAALAALDSFDERRRALVHR